MKRTITHENFRDCLFNKTVFRREQNTIRSRKHAVHTECQEKVALNFFDDKRYQIPGTTATLPWGHKDIPEEEGVPHKVLIEPQEPAELIQPVNELERSPKEQQQLVELSQHPVAQQQANFLDTEIPEEFFKEFEEDIPFGSYSPPTFSPQAKRARYF